MAGFAYPCLGAAIVEGCDEIQRFLIGRPEPIERYRRSRPNLPALPRWPRVPADPARIELRRRE
jgi:hypothetical protein